jgi:hypothetical protein
VRQQQVPHLTSPHGTKELYYYAIMDAWSVPKVFEKSSMIYRPFSLFKSRDNKYTLTNSIDI